jgi:hypothetical protein
MNPVTLIEPFGFSICKRCLCKAMEINLANQTQTQRCWGCKQPLTDRLYAAAHEEWLKRNTPSTTDQKD